MTEAKVEALFEDGLKTLSFVLYKGKEIVYAQEKSKLDREFILKYKEVEQRIKFAKFLDTFKDAGIDLTGFLEEPLKGKIKQGK